MKSWYKDRFFPEVKAGNDDIVAVIENEEQLERVIAEHNAALEEIVTLKRRIAELEEVMKKIMLTSNEQRICGIAANAYAPPCDEE